MVSLIARFGAAPALLVAAACGPSLPAPVEVPLPEVAPAPTSTPEAPAPPDPPPAHTPDREFDRGAASQVLSRAAGEARGCKMAGGPTGTVRIRVTFAHSGAVAAASISDAPFAGTPMAACIVAAFRAVRVPPFDGDVVVVTKSVAIL